MQQENQVLEAAPVRDEAYFQQKKDLFNKMNEAAQEYSDFINKNEFDGDSVILLATGEFESGGTGMSGVLNTGGKISAMIQHMSSTMVSDPAMQRVVLAAVNEALSRRQVVQSKITGYEEGFRKL